MAEVLSCSKFLRDILLTELKDHLCKNPFKKWIPFIGSNWQNMTKDTKLLSSELVILANEGDDTTKKKCVTVKEDKFTWRKLVSCQRIQAAYTNWCTVYTISPIIPMTRHEMLMRNFGE